MEHKSVLMNHKDTAVDMTCNGKCSNCGGCCNPWNPITNEEIETIKKYIKDNDIKYIPMVPEGNDIWFDCCFHDRKNKKCLIYPVRPEVCRAFCCNLNKRKINRNKYYYDRRADVNGRHLDKFYPFDLLFFDDPRTLFYFIMDVYHPKSPEQLERILLYHGHQDIVDAIKSGNITMDWSDK